MMSHCIITSQISSHLGPCAEMRRSNNDVDCDDDGNFDTRQCRRQQDDTYMCWCANPQDGRPDHSTMMIVNAERDFSRSDCIRRSESYNMRRFLKAIVVSGTPLI